MFNKTLFLILLIACVSINYAVTFHEIEMKTINGEKIDFSRYKNRAVLIGNLASQCGYTNKGYE